MDSVLIDLGGVASCHCDHGLEEMHKALAEDPAGTGESIWTPHENPWLRDPVEAWTGDMSGILEKIQAVLTRVLGGEPIGTIMLKSAVPWERWFDDGFRAALHELESKAPASYTLDDWLLLVDYLIQRYLPDGVIRSEAEYLTVRSAMAGKLQLNLDARRDRLPDDVTAAVVELVPTKFADVPPKVLTPVEEAILRVAHERVAENITALSGDMRHKLKGVILEHVQAIVLGQKEGTTGHLETRLISEFGALNRDMRRIAITEAGEAMAQGQVAACKHGAKLVRLEAYRGACPWCQSIQGKIVTVVDPAKPNKDGDNEVWVGKTNIGRSASPMKKVDGILIPREPHEMWWIAAGLQHPHCRGGWGTGPSEPPPGVIKEFDAYLKDLVAKGTAKYIADQKKKRGVVD